MNKEKENGLLWTRTILELYNKLPKMAKAFEKASNVLVDSSLITGMYGNGHTTEELYEKMIDLNYRKMGIINLKALTDMGLKRIEPSLVNVLTGRFFLKLDNATIAEKEKISMRTVFRKIDRGIEKLCDTFASLGFTAKRLDIEYADEPLILREKRRVQEKILQEKESYSKSS